MGIHKVFFLFLVLVLGHSAWSISKIETLTKETGQRFPQQEESAPSPRAPGQHALGLGIGQTFLMGGFDQSDKVTWQDFFYSYTASHSFDFILNGHNSKHGDLTLKGVAVGIKRALFHFDAFSPFFLGGFGLYFPNDEMSFGIHASLGADLRLNRNMAVGFSAHHHDPFVSGYYGKLLFTISYIF